MDFTREPIIETIITPKDGYKLVVRSSKSAVQEEYFVDAVEVVAFGHALFFRSSERPKAFLVPISDYEVLEVREARMVLKNVGIDRSIKIGGGKEAAKPSREQPKLEALPQEESEAASETEIPSPVEASPEVCPEPRLDKKRDRRRHSRKRRGREEGETAKAEEGGIPILSSLEGEKIAIPSPQEIAENLEGGTPLSSSVLSSLLQPPPTLISETISRYRENALFKSAFFMTEEEEYKPHDRVEELLSEDDEIDFIPPLQKPTFEEEEEEEESNLSEEECQEEQDAAQEETAFEADVEFEHFHQPDLPFLEELPQVQQSEEELKE